MACTGTLGGPGNGDPEWIDSSSSALCPGESPMRRLTRTEYNHTVRDLLGDDTEPASSIVVEEESLGFDNQAATLTVSPLLAEQYMDVAEGVSERATTDLPGLLGCDAGESSCTSAFIRDFGKRAYRRPLDDDEIDAFEDLFERGNADFGSPVGIQLVIQAALQSPHFLYRVEFGTAEPIDGQVVKLSHWEMASRLSYLLWNSMPDEALFAAADNDQLGTPAEIAAQAARLLDDPRARAAVANFHRQWLGLDSLANISKNASIYPNYNDGLNALWRQETEAFVERVVFEEQGDLETLLRANFSMMNADLAAFYGVSGPTGDEFVKVPLDDTKRAGLLTHAGLLAAHAKTNQSSPVLRGRFVREQLLCQMIPPPPDDVDAAAPEVGPDATTAEKFAQHSSDPACKGCHVLMDPIGLGFEHYDGIGQWRDTDQDFPVDASGELVSTDDVDGTFYGAAELSERLASSEQVRRCVVTQWFRFGYGRGEKPADQCSLDQLNEAFEASGRNIKDLLIALTQTDAFLYRKGGAQ